MQSRFFTLRDYPTGTPPRELFELRQHELPALDEGEVRIRNTWLSVDPYMRGRMSGVRTYVAPFELNAPMEGAAIGEVVESRHTRFKAGDKVRHMAGWRDVAQLKGDVLESLPDMDVPDQAYLGVLGMPGMTAWTGLNRIANLREGDNVLVSAASGAVGSLAVQLAKAKGGTVVGIAGAADKLEWLEQRDIHAVSYKGKDARQLGADLEDACPEGFDVYFENVGGDCLEAALDHLKVGARIAICGLISRYNSEAPDRGPSNLANLLVQRARMQGFIVADHWTEYPHFLEEVGPRVARGEIDYAETVEEGLERTPDAFLKLFEGANRGKMLIRL
ncbi:NADP-dependent oxidoreductase [Halomonas sp. MCCC 1A17488]|uniref:NADP-dependent oxidoreductase n=1 Tax=Billgrantia sulfidoxydans TaxID=2733484 RepID=A0ABX7W001_9GAMM|nr:MULTISPECIES: NADP-dependent oxidoreductase [Halomonas]MCE8016594.1 NADP-dependent oxidoreductase [Halomonas sp. MCCC 1A17488]MCG3239927.1 NADP-dependent oxidoreductase [Halomonas sp. MCCC 1A17488]QPP50180.1 NADP-dependent oxidoreductase [Halomonas sp. SS10-MC5]QTP53799.1 NADP-dependent oxidoreductase [Halomonas sulfidoxydans]